MTQLNLAFSLLTTVKRVKQLMKSFLEGIRISFRSEILILGLNEDEFEFV